jgi:hypothetical protein
MLSAYLLHGQTGELRGDVNFLKIRECLNLFKQRHPGETSWTVKACRSVPGELSGKDIVLQSVE